jgi:ankyrin repeat protein
MGRLSLLFFVLYSAVVQAKSVEECIYAIKCSSYDDVKKAFDDPSSDITQKGPNGLTPLLSASYEGRSDVVLYLFLTKKADLEETDQQKRNLFHLASLKGNLGVIQLIGNKLKQSKAQLFESLLKAQDDLGMTPVHLAAQYGHRDILDYFLDAGIDQNMPDGNGKSPLYWALKNKQDSAAEVLISSKGFNINYQSPWGLSALHEASRGGHIDVVKGLVDKGADLNILDVDGRTPLYWAAERGHPAVVSFLLDKGADPKVMDEDKRTILHRAARYGHTAVVKILLSKTKLDVNEEDPLGNTPLCWAVRNGHVETAKALLAAKAKLTDLTKEGREIFHHVAQSGNQAMVRLLVNNGLDVNEEDQAGKTALHHAAAKGNKGMVSLLVNLGANTNKEDENGQTPLDVAATSGTSGAVKVLVAQENGDINTLQTALYHASNASNTQTMETLLNAHKDNKDLLSQLFKTPKINVYAKDVKGKSLFDHAVTYGDIKLLTLLMLIGDQQKIVALLKGSKANFDTLDKKDRMTMLHYAALMGEGALVQSIIDGGASIDLPQQDGSTALHNAVSGKSAGAVDALLKAKASFLIQNKRGETAFTKAIHAKFGEGVSVFLKHGADPSAYVGSTRPQEEAIKSGNAEMVELFMDHVKGDMKALDDFHNKEVLQQMKDDQDMTLIHWIGKKGHSGLLDVALRLAVRPFMSGVDKTGRTALHYAASGGFSDIITKLYNQEDSGLDLNTQSNDRTTALHEAAINHHPDTVKVLIKLGADQTLKDNKGKAALDYLPKAQTQGQDKAKDATKSGNNKSKPAANQPKAKKS